MPATNQRRVGGIITVKINGEIQNAKGEFTYSPGVDKRSAVVGVDRVHGFKSEPQVPYVEGAITDRKDLDVPALFATTDATITLELANGKVFVLRDAWYAGDGTVKTGEGEIAIRFEGLNGEEVK